MVGWVETSDGTKSQSSIDADEEVASRRDGKSGQDGGCVVCRIEGF